MTRWSMAAWIFSTMMRTRAGNAVPGRVGEGLRSAARLGGRAWIGGR